MTEGSCHGWPSHSLPPDFSSLQASSELETRINHVLSLAARKTDFQQMSVALEALRTELEKTDEKAALAVRFVEWFTERGDAYEHNLQTVDRHLSKLGESAIHGRRDPSIRFV